MMSTELQILPLSRGANHVNRFLEVSYGIYRGDSHWVAPLLLDARKIFADANPLFEHAALAH